MIGKVIILFFVAWENTFNRVSIDGEKKDKWNILNGLSYR